MTPDERRQLRRDLFWMRLEWKLKRVCFWACLLAIVLVVTYMMIGAM